MNSKSTNEVSQLRRALSEQNEVITGSFKVIDRLGIVLKGNHKELDIRLAELRRLIKKDALSLIHI